MCLQRSHATEVCSQRSPYLSICSGRGSYRPLGGHGNHDDPVMREAYVAPPAVHPFVFRVHPSASFSMPTHAWRPVVTPHITNVFPAAIHFCRHERMMEQQNDSIALELSHKVSALKDVCRMSNVSDPRCDCSTAATTSLFSRGVGCALEIDCMAQN